MKTFHTLVNKLSLWGAYLASFLIVSLMLLILIEIFIRYVFDSSTMIADEYSGYLYLASIFLGLAYTFNEKAHIRINIITSKLNKKKNRLVDIFAYVISILVIAFVFYRSILFAYDSYKLEMLSEAVSETPLYLTQIVIPIGLSLFLLSILSFLIKELNNDI